MAQVSDGEIVNGLIRAVGVAENANLKHRARMEDRYVTISSLIPGSAHDASFLAVYDGHGGREAADYAAETLHKNLMTELQAPGGIQTDMGGAETAIENAYLSTDKQMKLCVPQSCGTTAVTALVVRGKQAGVSSSAGGGEGARVLYVANVGDARAVLCRNMEPNKTTGQVEAERMSVDHKPGDPDEKLRIEQAGGAVINHRVLGVLAVSRALGDHELKSLVSGKPFVRMVDLPGTKGQGLLILACDGIFDVMSDRETIEFVIGKYKVLINGAEVDGKNTQGRDQYVATALARSLVQEAIKRSTRDNVTAVIALL
mmetsp:Transcript_12533/g.17119  ORF Transcript_12533/g.17119 Transcript_12533/m.17119 type:complete len:315 (+) Transcript_12533:79-1023(+)|eukprot:CAMPEP_0196581262 /NCGR_PEP_ID=MMETSP1081-20130531/33238_1 /TAXON_ID=36882 /ORGANISM="Pyramimonas amylifera, Strain CCMP720" /LENGTH=314 /DNA_ID=CAMNT_0041901423 /DNA_START=79 /DNA_END=1023 /DNA_ORIENTATION=+